MQKVKSININTTFDKKTVKENMNKPLVRVQGVAYGTIEATTKFGTNTGFKGDFVAVNLLTGECFESDAAFLPKGLTQDIEKRLNASETHEVEFNAVLVAIDSDKNDKGYAWVAEHPKTEAMLSRRERMKQEALEASKKIAALPKPEGAKEQKPATKGKAA